jgi:hypothetical protein
MNEGVGHLFQEKQDDECSQLQSGEWNGGKAPMLVC